MFLKHQPNDYLTLHLHRNKGRFEKIWYPGKSGDCVLTGIYTNNPHVLVRYDIEGPEDAYLTAVLSQYKKSNDLGYTLSCYCTEEFSLGKPQTDLKHTKSINSGWTTSLSGGPLGRSTFRFNPMFALWVPEDGTILQMAATTSTTSAVNIICFAVTNFGQGFDHSFGDPLLDSGNYRHGFVVTRRKKLNKGPYVIVVSNFHKDEVASFLLKIMSSIKVQVEVIK
jgi:Calpain large subunit, domain III